MSKPLTAQHSEWLSLVEVSGPFLTLPVLKRALPMGLDPTPLPLVDDLRVAWKEVGDDESLTPRWIRWVLSDLLELPDEVLKEGTAIGPAFTYTVPEHSVRLRPDLIVVDPDAPSDAPARLLVTLLPAGTELDERLPDSKWSADAVDRMAELCRGTRVRLGLVTNGDQWALVDAPLAGPTGIATWDANLWLEERITLDAFTTLLGVRRFFSVAPEDTLEAMLAESANAEAEVTDQLGKQVRQAVELLVDAMSRANRDRGGHLFDDLTAEQVYEAAVTVMMRLVFLLSAEERGLFLLGDETYDSTYAVSTLRGQLEEEANTFGEEVIARRTDAWHRLLATFRMVYGGAQHENLRLPAYGGSLFDPDRFPILEGRKADEPWRSSPSSPLPIDNRTVLHILGALQVLTFKDRRGVKEARRLSFRALDVEQIGHVYEGLLDHSAVRVDEVALGLGGKKDPEIALALVEAAADKGRDELVEYLAELTGMSARAVEKALDAEHDPLDLERLTSACDNDLELADRVAPYLGLLRLDLAELPTIYLPTSMYVTQSSDRRSSGTYYTPKALAEDVVLHALEPLVYSPGPSEGVAPIADNLRSSIEILNLKICDMAMGSGAFLVASCRYLSGRLIEAWDKEEIGPGDPIPMLAGGSLLLPQDANDRDLLARRLVADSCLYGVDRNPMAVEMAKLSMWLITLAKDRPFTFVDHALRCGDSLLGITNLEQLECLHLDPSAGRTLHGGTLFDPTTRIEPMVRNAVEKRRQLESFPVVDIVDAERKQSLLDSANGLLAHLRVMADLIVGAAISGSAESRADVDRRIRSVATDVVDAFDLVDGRDGRSDSFDDLRMRAEYWLDEGRPALAPDRSCLHWPLEFPEVFLDRPTPGFDAVVGNPPFVAGTNLLPVFGRSYREFLVAWLGGGIRGTRGQADLVAYFFLRAVGLLSEGGCMGLIATNTIGQGDTREVGLDQIVGREGATIYRAEPSMKWPGSAGLEVSLVWISSAAFSADAELSGVRVETIDARLSNGSVREEPEILESNRGLQFQGCKLQGDGFLLTPDEARSVLDSEPAASEVVLPFLNGHDLNSSPAQQASRWVIFFRDWTEERARQFPLPFEIVEKHVKPERRAAGSSGWRKRPYEKWWQFREIRPTLFSALKGLESCFAIAVTSRTVMPVRIDVGQVPSHAVVVFASEDTRLLAWLSSCFHYQWAIANGSTMRSDLRYTPTSCFETFPMPLSGSTEVEIMEELEVSRSAFMIGTGCGLTATYNRVHDADDHDPAIRELRARHAELDEAVARAYGWEDLRLRHDFYSTAQGPRFSPDPSVCAEMLERLRRLNVARREEEKASQTSSGKRPARAGRRKAPENQLSLDPRGEPL